VLQLPDIVTTPLDQQLATTTTTTTTTTTSSSCQNEMVYDESNGAEFATPDMDSQLLYVKLKEVFLSTLLLQFCFNPPIYRCEYANCTISLITTLTFLGAHIPGTKGRCPLKILHLVENDQDLLMHTSSRIGLPQQFFSD